MLTRDGQTRRIPFWVEVEPSPASDEPAKRLSAPGIYRATTVGGESKVVRYRYPTKGDGSYPGPEVAYLVHVSKPIANFGVAVLSGSAIPHVVFAGDENHLTGFTGLPTDLNPYLETFGESRPVAGVDLPAPGSYEIVFDTRSASRAGPFTFRYWINDTTPPKLHVLDDRPEDRRRDHGRRRRSRPVLGAGDRRRPQHPAPLQPQPADPPCRPRPAPADRDGVRLPGAEEHGRRRADQAEHVDPPQNRNGSVALAVLRVLLVDRR